MAFGMSYPLGIGPWSANERCTLKWGRITPTLRSMFDAWAVTASHHARLGDYPQGIALLTAMEIHFNALEAGLLVGEQVAQLLDMLPGEFPRDRLALLSRRWCC